MSRQVTWTSYNKPKQITGDGATETFVYGPDRSRLVTAITKGSDVVTTTYIDGLFEQVYDSTTGDLTYKHYILAGGARVGVETIAANSGGTVTSDTLSFYVRDEVGSVIAMVTENLGGANQTVSLSSYDAWGKARPTSGTTAYQDPAPGMFYSPTPSGQEEGFAGHDNLEDTGLVDMEGRVYDPEVGTFLSADLNVQYPFSSQGYDRYLYVNDNPLSLSDPSGYFSFSAFMSNGDPMAGFFPQQYGEALSVIGPIVGAALNAVPGCQVWCDYVVTMASEAEAGYLETGSVGAGLRAGVLAGAVGWRRVSTRASWTRPAAACGPRTRAWWTARCSRRSATAAMISAHARSRSATIFGRRTNSRPPTCWPSNSTIARCFSRAGVRCCCSCWRRRS